MKKKSIIEKNITNVNLHLLFIVLTDCDEECNRTISKFVRHFIDSTGRLQCFRIRVAMAYVIYMLLGLSFICMCAC